MDIPPRLAPLLDQFDWGCLRLLNRMTGPQADSGNGSPVLVEPLTTEEYLWEPVPGSWSVRRRADGPGPLAALLDGAGEWGRDSYRDKEPYPPPFTTIAWRASHLSEMLALRADYTAGSRSLTSDGYVVPGDANGAVAALAAAVESWRGTLLACDDAALDTVRPQHLPLRQRRRGGLHRRRSGGSTRRCCTTAPRSRCSATSTALATAERRALTTARAARPTVTARAATARHGHCGRTVTVAFRGLRAGARGFSLAYMSACLPSPGLRRSISNSVVAVIKSLSLPYP